MDPGLLIVLRGHNPWLADPPRQAELLAEQLPDPFVPRRAALELRAGSAELIVGPRQAGKSTWLREALSGRKEPVLVLHADEPRIRELCRSPAQALHALAGVLTERTILVFEELQRLEDAALFLKGVVDLQPRRKIAATGSSSFQLRARTRESLAGRARRTLLLPFSLEELAARLPAGRPAAVHDDEQRDLWERLVVVGGYPRAWLAAEPEQELHRLVEAFILRDASDLHAIERPGAFRRLLELAAADAGNLVNLSSWAAVAAVSRDTAARYLDLAQEAHLLRLVPPFASGKRAEITGAPKVFFLDNGLRNVLVGGFEASGRRADRGALWENAVFTELAKRLRLLDGIFHWRTRNKAEVDFVVRRGDRILGIEVTAGPLDRPRLSRSARSFIDAVRPARFGVINAALRDDATVDGVPVLFRRPWELGDLLTER
ncbi:MAG: ATP-binding protein [Deltaproteobacteria bacterium]|nr:ATP-binding protein [Deltaproteobacteria bacterium]